MAKPKLISKPKQLPIKQIKDEYDTIHAQSRHIGEYSDCAVKAVALATGLSYAKVHKIFKLSGRKTTKSTRFSVTLRALDNLGYRLKEDTKLKELVYGSSLKTVEAWLNPTKIYLISTSGHILCAKHGVIADWTRGTRRLIKNIYELEDEVEF